MSLPRQIKVQKVIQDLAGNARTNITYYAVKRGSPTTDQVAISLTRGGAVEVQPVTSSDGVIEFYTNPQSCDLIVQGTGFASIRYDLEVVKAGLNSAPISILSIL